MYWGPKVRSLLLCTSMSLCLQILHVCLYEAPNEKKTMKLPNSEAIRGAGKVSPCGVKLHTLSPDQLRARGQRRVLVRTAPFVTTAINILLWKSADVCPSGCFTTDNWMYITQCSDQAQMSSHTLNTSLHMCNKHSGHSSVISMVGTK